MEALLVLLPFGEGAAVDHSTTRFLVQIVLMLGVGRLCGELFHRLGLSSVLGQVVAGILIGPSVFGACLPDAFHAVFPDSREQKKMIDAIGQIGVLMLLLLTGMETDLSLVRRVRKAAFSVSIAGIAVPFLCGYLLGELLPDAMLPAPEQRAVTSLFLGTALSISSVKIVAVVLQEMNFLRRGVGQVILATAVIDDTIGWILIAIISSIATHGSVSTGTVLLHVLGTILFLALSLTFGRRLVGGLIRWANDTLQIEFAVISTILVIMGAMALATDLMGVHSVLGAFVAGIVIGQSPLLTKHIEAQLRGLIVAFFMPIFFASAGLSTNLTILATPSLLALTLALIAVASIGKFSGALLGSRLGGMTRAESLAVACGMNARGSTEVIVASIGLGLGVLSQNLFTMIVSMAIATTVAMPPMLRWALKRVPIGAEEKQRLEREEAEARGYLASVERILVAADDSANGHMASRLAGIVAGSRQILTTVLDLSPAATPEATAKGSPVGSTATDAAASSATEMGAQPPAVEVTKPQRVEEPEVTVAGISKRGYDLMVIGLGQATSSSNVLGPDLHRITNRFEGSVGIALSRTPHTKHANPTRLDILVPVNGADYSRRAAEVGLCLARAGSGRVTVLYVSTSPRVRTRPRWRDQLSLADHEEEILRDILRLAEIEGVPIQTKRQAHPHPEEAILQEVATGLHSLVLLGVSRRPGEALFFGNTPQAVVDRCPVSVFLLSTASRSGLENGA